MEFGIIILPLFAGLFFLSVSFFLSLALNRTIFKIPNVLFEVLGLALLAFSWGADSNTSVVFLLVIGAIVAMVIDPYIWKWLGHTEEIGTDVKKFSVKINGAVFSIAALSYGIGMLIGTVVM